MNVTVGMWWGRAVLKLSWSTAALSSEKFYPKKPTDPLRILRSHTPVLRLQEIMATESGVEKTESSKGKAGG